MPDKRQRKSGLCPNQVKEKSVNIHFQLIVGVRIVQSDNNAGVNLNFSPSFCVNVLRI